MLGVKLPYLGACMWHTPDAMKSVNQEGRVSRDNISDVTPSRHTCKLHCNGCSVEHPVLENRPVPHTQFTAHLYKIREIQLNQNESQRHNWCLQTMFCNLSA